MMMNDEYVEEIHKIREEITRETSNMTTKERVELKNKIGNEIIDKYGLKKREINKNY